MTNPTRDEQPVPTRTPYDAEIERLSEDGRFSQKLNNLIAQRQGYLRRAADPGDCREWEEWASEVRDKVGQLIAMLEQFKQDEIRQGHKHDPACGVCALVKDVQRMLVPEEGKQ